MKGIHLMYFSVLFVLATFLVVEGSNILNKIKLLLSKKEGAVKDCTNCKYGDEWQKGDTFSFNKSNIFCGCGKDSKYLRFLINIKGEDQYVNYIIVGNDGNKIDCGKWEER